MLWILSGLGDSVHAVDSVRVGWFSACCGFSLGWVVQCMLWILSGLGGSVHAVDSLWVGWFICVVAQFCDFCVSPCVYSVVVGCPNELFSWPQ